MQVAKTIADQLGGAGRLRAMVGAYNLAADKSSLTFRFKGNRKINTVRITLDAADTYSVEFIQIRNFEVKTVTEYSGVYADRLRDVFEAATGLYLSLGAMGGA